jgi:large-conductance mechanosensitive channel
VTVLAAGTSDVGPGLLAFLIVAAIGFALFLLVKSMNKQISKIEVPHEADLDKTDREPKTNGAH